jgi:hypothetical protein
MKEFNSSKDVHVFFALLSSIYSSMISYAYFTLKLLIERGYFESFIEWSKFTYKSPAFNPANIKNIIIGICAIFAKSELLNELGQYIKVFINVAFRLLNCQSLLEKDKLKRRLKKEVDCNFIYSDNESDDEEEEDEKEDNQEDR